MVICRLQHVHMQYSYFLLLQSYVNKAYRGCQELLNTLRLKGIANNFCTFACLTILPLLMQSLGFRLFLFFLFADVALFAILVMPEDGYTSTPAVIASEAPARTENRGFISAKSSPHVHRATTPADTISPTIRYLQKQKKLN